MSTDAEPVVVVVKASARREPPFEETDEETRHEFAALRDAEAWVAELNQATGGTFYLQTANSADKAKGIDQYLMFRHIVSL